MILPLGDSPNPRSIPVVTWAILAANVAVYLFVTLPLSVVRPDPTDPALLEYLRVVWQQTGGSVPLPAILAQVSAYDLFVFEHGFRPAAPEISDLFTAMFLHGGLAHLAGNMLFLWIYGDNVEHRLGPLRYLVAYLGTGVCATLFHAVFLPKSPLPLVGASGAISGVLGLYFLWFPRNQVRLLVVLFPFLVDVVLLPARVLLALYLIVDNLLPFLMTHGTGSGVAYGAHIGGFLAGVGVAWWVDRSEEVRGPRAFTKGQAAADRGDPARDIAAALSEGRFADAARMYFALQPAATRRILKPEQSLALAEWLEDNGHDDAALVVYRRHLRDYPAGPGAAQAHYGAGMIRLRGGQPAAAYQHFLEALEHDVGPAEEARIRQAMQAALAQQKFQVRGYRRGLR